MADASDSKSDEGDLVWVQVPSPAYLRREIEPVWFGFHAVFDQKCRPEAHFKFSCISDFYC